MAPRTRVGWDPEAGACEQTDMRSKTTKQPSTPPSFASQHKDCFCFLATSLTLSAGVLLVFMLHSINPSAFFESIDNPNVPSDHLPHAAALLPTATSHVHHAASHWMTTAPLHINPPQKEAAKEHI
uniref:Uncharacterized protein n=1 Tax=Eutreptiella gymnastica TaxID=73025 RepID=A0A7S4G5A9_9EUGL|mmetsp:Transcript_45421/g.76493  ORF Transcript_45421/g.76493 Transcript_45421/m.76493 type:complete len:126 (+) Transcript_45421:60-437(+)